MENKVSPRTASSNTAPSLTGRAAAPVAIGLPVYNGDPYLRLALESLLAQTGVDFELHIADNCSTDGTQELCRDFARRDERVVYHRREHNVGVTANHNLLVGEVDSPYFAWAGADDACRPNRLTALFEALRARPDAVMAFSSAAQINADGEVIGTWQNPCRTDDPDPVVRLRDMVGVEHQGAKRYRKNVSFDSAPMAYGLFRRDMMLRTKLLPPVKNNDRLMLAELALHGPFVEVREPLLLHRHHEQRLTQATTQRDWYRTQRGDGRTFVLPNVEEAGWYLRAVSRSPLPLAERGRAMLALYPWMRANAVPMARNVAKAAVEAARLAVGGRARS
ncbi:glycosyltransferase family 2 protein [Allokutzneria multivorans]|uniref:Glycosyltransferase family 2 protein n=1 Tax=Allokutzneria multivorans TaxID=1142134 RepID=A0ABP7SZ30_9PSEU